MAAGGVGRGRGGHRVVGGANTGRKGGRKDVSSGNKPQSVGGHYERATRHGGIVDAARGHNRPTVHHTSAGQALAIAGLHLKGERIEAQDSTSHGIPDSKMGPADYLHPTRGRSSEFTKKQWDESVQPTSSSVGTGIFYNNHEIWTVAARDGTRLFFYLTGKDMRAPEDSMNDRYIIPWGEIEGRLIFGGDRPTGSDQTVFGLPPDMMGPGFIYDIDSAESSYDIGWPDYSGYYNRDRFAAREWDEIVSPEQTPLATDYRYLGNPVLTVTAKDGSQLYYVSDSDGVHSLLSWNKLREAPSPETGKPPSGGFFCE